MCRLMIFFILPCFPLLVTAQPLNVAGPEAFFAAFIVEDLDTSIVWYSDTWGFKIVDKKSFPNMGFKQANLELADIRIELIELESALDPSEVIPNYDAKTKLMGIFKFGLLLPDFDVWIKHLQDLGVIFHGGIVDDQLRGKKMTIVLDPDGNRIQLFEK